MRTIRLWLFKLLNRLSWWVYPDKRNKPRVSPEDRIIGGGVVEVSNKPKQWSPSQKGGVVVVEPKLVALERKQKNDMSDVPPPWR